MTPYIIALILVFMVIAAVVALEIRDTLAAVVALAAVGIGVSIAFLFLGAPDLAITQVVVEVLVLLILIRATISRDVTTIQAGKPQFVMTIAVSGLLILLLFSLHVVEVLPAFGLQDYTSLAGSPSLQYLKEAASETGATNVVAAILLDYRVYDTLGEVTVLFVSLVGVWTVLRKRGRLRGEPDSVEGGSGNSEA